MAASLEDIRLWLKYAKDDPKIIHMIVVCDTYDYDDYAVYVYDHQDVHDIERECHNKSMQRVMEVYSMSKDLEEQLAKERSFNYD